MSRTIFTICYGRMHSGCRIITLMNTPYLHGYGTQASLPGHTRMTIFEFTEVLWKVVISCRTALSWNTDSFTHLIGGIMAVGVRAIRDGFRLGCNH